MNDFGRFPPLLLDHVNDLLMTCTARLIKLFSIFKTSDVLCITCVSIIHDFLSLVFVLLLSSSFRVVAVAADDVFI